MPKVLRIINRFNLGGPTYNAAYLTKYLPEEYETLLIGGEKDDSEDSSEYILHNLGLKPIILSSMKRSINPFKDRKAYKEIKRIIREFKPDIVHTHASKAGSLGRRAAYSCNVPVIVHTFHGHVFHSYFNKYITEVFKFIERRLARKSSKIIAISDKQKYELSLIHKITKANNIEVIPLGFDLERFSQNQEEKRVAFRKQYQINDDEIAIGIIGRIVPIKNHDLFVEAIDYVLKNTTKKVKAFIIGDGESRLQIEQKAKNLNIAYNTEEDTIFDKPLVFTSWIKEIDVANAGLDIVALTSLNEGTPVSLIEAQASNRPIVSTKVGGIENVVNEGKSALLSDLSKPDDFNKNLLKLVEEDNLRKEMSKNGASFVREAFHYKRLVSDIDKLYKLLLQQNSSKP